MCRRVRSGGPWFDRRVSPQKVPQPEAVLRLPARGSSPMPALRPTPRAPGASRRPPALSLGRRVLGRSLLPVRTISATLVVEVRGLFVPAPRIYGCFNGPGKTRTLEATPEIAQRVCKMGFQCIIGMMAPRRSALAAARLRAGLVGGATWSLGVLRRRWSANNEHKEN